METRRSPDPPPPPVLAPALATWLRYAAPLTALSAVALAPVIALALRAQVPVDAASSNAMVARGWAMIALAWLGQLVLIGGATAVTTARPSQLAAFTRGLVRELRAIVPCLAAIAAIAVGCLAGIVPGVVLIALLVLTGASEQRGLPAPLVDSIGFARRHLAVVALAAGAMLALDLAIGVVAQLAFARPLARPPAPGQLVAVRQFVRVIAIALVVASPLPATVLAAIRTRRALGRQAA